MNTSAPETANRQGFETQLLSLRPDMLRFALWLARDRATAEDVVQESLLRAWRARSELMEPAALRGWMFTIVRREYARLFERKRLPLTDIDELVATEDVALAVSEGQEMTELRNAMLRLPHEYREPLVMQVLGGFSTAEIAAQLGLSQPAVLTRLFRARDKLREVYGLAPRGSAAADAAERGGIPS